MTINEIAPFPNHLGPMTLTDARALLPSIKEDDPALSAIVAIINAQDAFNLLLIMSACQQRAEEINAEPVPEYIDAELEANVRELNSDHKRWIKSPEFNPTVHKRMDGSPLQ